MKRGPAVENLFRQTLQMAGTYRRRYQRIGENRQKRRATFADRVVPEVEADWLLAHQIAPGCVRQDHSLEPKRMMAALPKNSQTRSAVHEARGSRSSLIAASSINSVLFRPINSLL
ncbi:MAG: hypothetical protein JWL62_74 [Hyphomicrobiales bacterium]|nr:hypothetical protein [Hyphomicrobiales bacterium]